MLSIVQVVLAVVVCSQTTLAFVTTSTKNVSPLSFPSATTAVLTTRSVKCTLFPKNYNDAGCRTRSILLSNSDNKKYRKQSTLVPGHQTTSLPQKSALSASSTSSSSTSSSSSKGSLKQFGERADAVVCGAGPAGLLTAIMLAQKFEEQEKSEKLTSNNKNKRIVKVYDRLGPPPNADDDTVWYGDSNVAKFYLLGLGPRGQNALKKFGVWQDMERRCVAVVGRRDWAPGGDPEGTERIFSSKEKRVSTQVLPRDKLVSVLYQHILENYNDRIQLNFGCEVQPLDFDYNKKGEQVLIQVNQCSKEVTRLNPSMLRTASEDTEDDILCDVSDSERMVATDLLIAADGTVRTFANAMERADQKRLSEMNPLKRLLLTAVGSTKARPFRVKRYVDNNQRVYKTIPFKVPKDWRFDLNYSARTKDGGINFDALPANKKGEYCGVLLLRKQDPLAAADSDPKDLRKRMEDYLPQFSKLLDDKVMESVAKKPVSYLPGFRYVGPRLHQGNRCLMLGDCAHTVKPYFGLGANSALEDVSVLSDILDANQMDFTKSVQEFSNQRAKDSEMLVKISRNLDRPGALGFVTFILPLILDSIFSKLAPKLFTPNIIQMMQREDYTFSRVARRKRSERIGQASIIGGTLFGMGYAAKRSIKATAVALGRESSTVASGFVLAVVAASAAKRLLSQFMDPSLSPADVLSKLSKRDDETNGAATKDEEHPNGSKREDDILSSETVASPAAPSFVSAGTSTSSAPS